MNEPRILSRRDALRRFSTGFGAAALSGLLAEEAMGASARPEGAPHYAPKVKSVIFLFMSGGVSAIDTFDPKPRLTKDHGMPMPMKVERTQFNNNGNIYGSPYAFRRYGESGLPVSEIFPHVAQHADSLAVIRSMTSKVNEHAQGNLFLHTGFPFMGHPSAGAWCSYGLGTENRNLPGYMVLRSGNAGVPHGGVGMFGNGYLPAQHQASMVQADKDEAIRNIRAADPQAVQRRKLDFIAQMDRKFSVEAGAADPVDAAIRNYETAFRMQAAIPDVCDIKGESPATRKLYGLDSGETQQAGYSRQCLVARRMVERGVRFVELSCLSAGIGLGGSANPWDQHGKLEQGHRAMAHQVDQGIGALITDLKARGLFESTLLVWAGEFGRTPFSQGSDGRDHNPYGFSVWMAGGGIRGGTVYGATDEYGYHAIENRCTVYDLWATVLHLCGVDHEALTYRHGGRDLRLTDVHGNVLRDILA